MRLSVFCGFLLLLLATTRFQAAEGWLFRCTNCRFLFKNRVPVRPTGCPFTCGLYCSDDACSVVCAKSCLLRAKEDVFKDMKPFPKDFNTYDHNKDGFINLSEFTRTLQADAESSAAALKLTDMNGDVKLDEKEFNSATYHKM